MIRHPETGSPDDGVNGNIGVEGVDGAFLGFCAYQQISGCRK
jgi:hypothetical protein